jgi:hypothetical protein
MMSNRLERGQRNAVIAFVLGILTVFLIATR